MILYVYMYAYAHILYRIILILCHVLHRVLKNVNISMGFLYDIIILKSPPAHHPYQLIIGIFP